MALTSSPVTHRFCSILLIAARTVLCSEQEVRGVLRIFQFGPVEGSAVESNRKGTSAPIGSLHSLFESSADREPERQALVFGERSFTFLELEQRSNRIAHQLRDMGGQPGQLVGVCLERTPDLVATLLAVLKSGAAYVPLDPAYPADRIAYVLGDAGAAILVTEDKVLEHLGKTPCRILSLAGDAGRIEKTGPAPVPWTGTDLGFKRSAATVSSRS